MRALLSEINEAIKSRAMAFSNAYLLFGLMTGLGNIGWYFFWRYNNLLAYENVTIRLLGSFFALMLAAHSYWPKWAKCILPYYWYFCLFYLLPFFFCFMFMMNGYSVIWQINFLAILVLLVLLTDWVSFWVVLVSGIACAWLAFLYFAPSSSLPPLPMNAVLNGGAILFFCVLFLRKRVNYFREQVREAQFFGSCVAHEIRTPLRSIESGFGAIESALPELILSYKMGVDAGLELPYLSSKRISDLTILAENIKLQTHKAFSTIEMLLKTSSQLQIGNDYKEIFSIKTCINDALEEYPFDPGQRERIKLAIKDDFIFKGDDELMRHVLFNLIKNSLYYIRNVNSGDITITTEAGKRYNTLTFMDTGEGIKSIDLPYIFNRFYTKTLHGTGIGLPYCRVVLRSFGGEIDCDSTYGDHTTFTMKFPVVERDFESEEG